MSSIHGSIALVGGFSSSTRQSAVRSPSISDLVKMETEVFVAVLGSITSLVGAAFAWLQALRTQRESAHAHLAVERMRNEVERRRKAFDIATDETAALAHALSRAWTNLQAIKDVIAHALSPAHFDPSLALEMLEPAVTEFSEGYNQYGAFLPANVQGTWHSAKSTIEIARQLLHQRGFGPQPAGEHMLSDADEHLRRIRSTITDYQMYFSEARHRLREHHMEHLIQHL